MSHDSVGWLGSKLDFCWGFCLSHFSSGQLLSVSKSLWPHALQHALPTTNSRNLLKLMSIESVMPSNHLIFCRPLLLLPSIFPSIKNESVLHIRWLKYWSLRLASVLPMNIQDWFPLGWTGWISLQFMGLFKSLLQHHSSKTSTLRHSAFFIVQLSHPYMTTGKP